MIKIRIIQNKTHEFEDGGKMVSYDLDESVALAIPTVQALKIVVQDLIDVIMTYGDNARIEITKVKED